MSGQHSPSISWSTPHWLMNPPSLKSRGVQLFLPFQTNYKEAPQASLLEGRRFEPLSRSLRFFIF
jgi:hypothetical protein